MREPYNRDMIRRMFADRAGSLGRLPPLSGTKDFAEYPLLRSIILRSAWRFFTQRLSEGGRWFLIFTGICAGYGTSSLELQGYVPLSYVAPIWILAGLWALCLRPRVALRARHAERVCCGEVLPVELEVEQTGLVTGADLWALPHGLPMAVDAVPPNGAPVAQLTRGKKTRVALGLRCNRRGVYRLKGYRVETDFPFGLMNAARHFRQERPLMVYPSFSRLRRLDLPIGRRYHPGGVALAAQRGESMEYIGNREFREGDNLRDVDWRATARLNKPIVREYREEYLIRVAVVLDTHIAAPMAGANESFERAISTCAAVAEAISRQDYLIDLMAAGPNLYHLTAGRSLAYLDQILDILACVDASPEEPFAVLEPEILENLAQITTVVCIFLDWTESRRAFALRLVSQGAAVKGIIVRDGPCSLDPGPDADLLGGLTVIGKADFEAEVTEL